MGQQDEFEKAFQSGQDVFKFSARGWPYHLDLRRMLQVNLSTQRERPVRRIEAQTHGDRETAMPRGERKVYSMLRCRVCLGSPYLIEGNLMRAEAMHDMCWCQDPSESLETAAETWSVAK